MCSRAWERLLKELSAFVFEIIICERNFGVVLFRIRSYTSSQIAIPDFRSESD